MPIILIKPNATISNDIPASGLSGGLDPHVILSDSSYLTRVRNITGAVGTLTRLGMETYALQENERIRGLRILLAKGQTHPLLVYCYLNNQQKASFGIWAPIPMPKTPPRVPYVSGWIQKNPQTGFEWVQADLDALEAYMYWRNPGGIFEARLYDVAVQVDVAPQPVTENVSPAFSAIIDQDRPRFRWQVDQEGTAIQNRYELKVFTAAVVEDVGGGFDPDTSEHYAFLSRITSFKAADLREDKWPVPLIYGGDFYFTVRTAVKFLNEIWWSEWSEPTPFSLNDPPTVDVLTPTGIVTDTNQPTVTWDYTDEQVNPQAGVEIAIFEAPPAFEWGENILTRTQSQIDGYGVLEVDFFESVNTVLTKEGEVGDQVLGVTRQTSTGTAIVDTTTGLGGRPVEPSTQYTSTIEVLADSVGRDVRLGMTWYDAAGASLGNSYSVGAPDSTSGYTKFTHTATSPANAAFASLKFEIQSVPIGEMHFVRRMALIQGTSNEWHLGQEKFPSFFDTDEEAKANGRVWWNKITGDAQNLDSAGIGVRLDNATAFRVYIRVAHRLVDGGLLWGQWDYEDFSTNYTAPPAPTFSAHTHNDRTLLHITPVAPSGGEPPPEFLRIERSLDGGETWAPFRYGTEETTDRLPVEEATLFDYEVPLFKDIEYRAYSVDLDLDIELQSPIVTASVVHHTNHKVRLINPYDAESGEAFPVEESWLQVSRRRTRSFKQPMGRSKPIVIRGAADSDSFEMTLIVLGEAMWDKLMTLLANHTLYIQTPKGSWYADVAGDIGHQDRLWDRRQGEQDVWKVTIPFQEVDFASD